MSSIIYALEQYESNKMRELETKCLKKDLLPGLCNFDKQWKLQGYELSKYTLELYWTYMIQICRYSYLGLYYDFY